MKLRHLALMLLYLATLTAGLVLGDKIGVRRTWPQAHRWAVKQAFTLAEEQVSLMRRTQGLREESMYRRGFETCQEQF